MEMVVATGAALFAGVRILENRALNLIEKASDAGDQLTTKAAFRVLETIGNTKAAFAQSIDITNQKIDERTRATFAHLEALTKKVETGFVNVEDWTNEFKGIGEYLNPFNNCPRINKIRGKFVDYSQKSNPPILTIKGNFPNVGSRIPRLSLNNAKHIKKTDSQASNMPSFWWLSTISFIVGAAGVFTVGCNSVLKSSSKHKALIPTGVLNSMASLCKRVGIKDYTLPTGMFSAASLSCGILFRRKWSNLKALTNSPTCPTPLLESTNTKLEFHLPLDQLHPPQRNKIVYTPATLHFPRPKGWFFKDRGDDVFPLLIGTLLPSPGTLCLETFPHPTTPAPEQRSYVSHSKILRAVIRTNKDLLMIKSDRGWKFDLTTVTMTTPKEIVKEGRTTIIIPKGEKGKEYDWQLEYQTEDQIIYRIWAKRTGKGIKGWARFVLSCDTVLKPPPQPLPELISESIELAWGGQKARPLSGKFKLKYTPFDSENVREITKNFSDRYIEVVDHVNEVSIRAKDVREIV